MITKCLTSLHSGSVLCIHQEAAVVSLQCPASSHEEMSCQSNTFSRIAYSMDCLDAVSVTPAREGNTG